MDRKVIIANGYICIEDRSDSGKLTKSTHKILNIEENIMVFRHKCMINSFGSKVYTVSKKVGDKHKGRDHA